jgi:hypothetical protein
LNFVCPRQITVARRQISPWRLIEEREPPT